MVGSRAAVSQTFKSACSEPSHPFMDSPRGYPKFSSYKRRHLPFVDDSTHNERTAVKASPCVGMEPHDCVPSRQDDLRKTTVERLGCMSASGTYRTSQPESGMSAAGGRAEVVIASPDFRVGPIPEIGIEEWCVWLCPIPAIHPAPDIRRSSGGLDASRVNQAIRGDVVDLAARSTDIHELPVT